MTATSTSALKWFPNALCLARLAAGPVVIILLINGYPGAAIGVYIAAALTDALDGWSARKLGVVSKLGAFLDPLADKVLNLCTLFAVAAFWPVIAPPWMAMCVWIAFGLTLARDVGVTVLRITKPNGGPAVVRLAKWKTAAEMTGLLAALVALAHGENAPLVPIAFGLIMLGATLSAITGRGYLWRR